MKRCPKLLDLFCGAGGASAGYASAGFEVTGVDISSQPHYPHRFIQADAMRFPLDGFDAIHASPPCQRYTVAVRIHDSAGRHPDLVGDVRERLRLAGKPFVIENVIGAPLHFPVMLCGTMFGLKVFRHRLFETNFFVWTPPHRRHDGSTGATDGYSTVARSRNGYVCVAGHNFKREEGAAPMGIDWMKTRRELAQAIPPAYCHFIGGQLFAMLEVAE